MSPLPNISKLQRPRPTRNDPGSIIIDPRPDGNMVIDPLPRLDPDGNMVIDPLPQSLNENLSRTGQEPQIFEGPIQPPSPNLLQQVQMVQAAVQAAQQVEQALQNQLPPPPVPPPVNQLPPGYTTPIPNMGPQVPRPTPVSIQNDPVAQVINQMFQEIQQPVAQQPVPNWLQQQYQAIENFEQNQPSIPTAPIPQTNYPQLTITDPSGFPFPGFPQNNIVAIQPTPTGNIVQNPEVTLPQMVEMQDIWTPEYLSQLQQMTPEFMAQLHEQNPPVTVPPGPTSPTPPGWWEQFGMNLANLGSMAWEMVNPPGPGPGQGNDPEHLFFDFTNYAAFMASMMPRPRPTPQTTPTPQIINQVVIDPPSMPTTQQIITVEPPPMIPPGTSVNPLGYGSMGPYDIPPLTQHNVPPITMIQNPPLPPPPPLVSPPLPMVQPQPVPQTLIISPQPTMTQHPTIPRPPNITDAEYQAMVNAASRLRPPQTRPTGVSAGSWTNHPDLGWVYIYEDASGSTHILRPGDPQIPSGSQPPSGRSSGESALKGEGRVSLESPIGEREVTFLNADERKTEIYNQKNEDDDDNIISNDFYSTMNRYLPGNPTYTNIGRRRISISNLPYSISGGSGGCGSYGGGGCGSGGGGGCGGGGCGG